MSIVAAHGRTPSVRNDPRLAPGEASTARHVGSSMALDEGQLLPLRNVSARDCSGVGARSPWDGSLTRAGTARAEPKQTKLPQIAHSSGPNRRVPSLTKTASHVLVRTRALNALHSLGFEDAPLPHAHLRRATGAPHRRNGAPVGLVPPDSRPWRTLVHRFA